MPARISTKICSTVATTPGLETNKHGCIVTDGDDGKTSRDGVYAGGDAVTGAATVIKAMGAGKAAAKAIDEYIQNKWPPFFICITGCGNLLLCVRN